jgi:putative phosphoribosyl transferase
MYLHDVVVPGRFFRDRGDAGRVLAEALEPYRARDPLVLGIPRGGVVVAAEVARRLGAELDVLVARKLGAPDHPELAIGAVTADGGRWLNGALVSSLGVDAGYINEISRAEMAEAHARETRFRGVRPSPEIRGRVVIVVDDGFATGATVRAAARALRRKKPALLVLAAPVGAPETCHELLAEADEVVCPRQPTPFRAVGLFYDRFDQTEDEEVAALLAGAHAAATPEAVLPSPQPRKPTFIVGNL